MIFFNTLKTNPKLVFLIDALGALVSTVFLLGVLVPLESYFGMPISILYILSGIAFCLFLFSISCHLFARSKWQFFIGILIIYNSAYTIISIALIIYNYYKIKTLGWTYFIIELLILGLVLNQEYQLYLYIKGIDSKYENK